MATNSALFRYTPVRLGVALALVASLAISLPIYPINLVVVPAVVFGVALLLIPVLAPLLLVISVPVQDVGRVQVAGFSLTGTRLALAAALAVLILQLLARGDRIRGTWLLAPFGLYLTAIVISLLGATAINAGFDVLYQWGVTLFALVLTLYAVRTRRQVLAMVSLMAAGAAADAFLGVIQAIGNLGPASYAVTAGVSRAFGTFGKPNSYAGYLEMTTPLAGVVAIWSAAQLRTAWRRYRLARRQGMNESREARRALLTASLLSGWLAAATAIGLAGILLSFSRGAWMGTAAAVLAMLLVSGRRSALVAGAGIMLAGLFLAAGGIGFAPAAIQDRYHQLVSQLTFFNSTDVLVTNQNFAAVERMAHWQTGIAMFLTHPWTGVGAGNFNVLFSQYAVNPMFTISRGHAHNYYIHAAAETGLFGLIAYLTLIFGALLVCFRSAREAPTGLGRAVGIGATGVTVAVMVHNIVEDLHVLNLGIQLSAVWALAIIAWRFLPATEAANSEVGTGPAHG